MFDKGVTVLFVSHSIEQVKAICDTAILLDHGKIIAKGDVDEVSDIYDQMTRGNKDSRAKAVKEEKEMLAKRSEKPAEAENKKTSDS